MLAAMAVGCSVGAPPSTPSPPAPGRETSGIGALPDLVYVGAVPSGGDPFNQARFASVQVSGELALLDVAAHPAVVLPARALAFAASFRSDGGATVQALDLRTGSVRSQIEAEPLAGPGIAYARGYQGAITALPDGESVVLGRHTPEGGAILLERYGVRSGARVASATLPGIPLWNVNVFLAAPLPDRLLARLYYWRNAGGGSRQESLVLDADLKVLARIAREIATGTAPSWPTSCSDPRALPASETLVTTCGDQIRRWVQFVDGRTLAPVARVDLPPATDVGFAIDWHVAPDGILTVLSERPALVRIDTRSRRLVDAREVSTGKSLLDLLAPSIALAKIYVSPNIQWSPDGRTVFVAPVAADIPHVWRQGVVAIDVSSATIAWRELRGEDVRGIHLSPDGARLYVLVSEEKEVSAPKAHLLALDARTGEVRARTPVLAKPAVEILAVAAR